MPSMPQLTILVAAPSLPIIAGGQTRWRKLVLTTILSAIETPMMNIPASPTTMPGPGVIISSEAYPKTPGTIDHRQTGPDPSRSVSRLALRPPTAPPMDVAAINRPSQISDSSSTRTTNSTIREATMLPPRFQSAALKRMARSGAVLKV